MLKLSPEQEEEIRRQWNQSPYASTFNWECSAEEWMDEIVIQTIDWMDYIKPIQFREGFIAAKGWNK